MTSHESRPGSQLFALIDGAASPGRIHVLLEESGAEFKSVFEGLPEEALGPASVFLARVDDRDASWFDELDHIDLYSPCLSLVWSSYDIDDVSTHLRAFLFADIGDGMRGLVRYFDPRNTSAILSVWGEQIAGMFIAPFDRWRYRGHHESWCTIDNEAEEPGRICKSVMIEFHQADLDALGAHTEADELLASLIQIGVMPDDALYHTRYTDFLARYTRANEWGIADAVDRLNFCRHTCIYGLEFDDEPAVRAALQERRETGEAYLAVIGRLPSSVWDELKRAQATRERMAAQAESTCVAG
ncbi:MULTISPECIES: DUF4123 domain-containing protein [unclassified Paraburkholderia]|uniref:DUF4123 domain-containing protein n=1 Tax=unclassified Paraburkholderia TaxID=2615204 RepID=UPI002AB03FB4|nr:MULTISPECIES: DUF4123 domain-containing protein [unclassified Paraburkholderia]